MMYIENVNNKHKYLILIIIIIINIIIITIIIILNRISSDKLTLCVITYFNKYGLFCKKEDNDKCVKHRIPNKKFI